MTKVFDAISNHSLKSDFWSAIIINEEHQEISIRKNVQEPISISSDKGLLITVFHEGAMAYASTQDLSESGIKNAYEKAFHWAKKYNFNSALKNICVDFQANKGEYLTPTERPFFEVPLDEKLELLKKADKILSSHKEIVDCTASFWGINTESHYVNSKGAEIFQRINRVIPSLSATANANGVTQTRTLGGMRAYCQQGGYEKITNLDLEKFSQDIVKDAIDLVHAENCPNDTCDVLIDPEQMMLQIHESIGHPIELDRILGDERNYAGTSFVTKDMIGSYQYGSKHLNVTFDPTLKEQFATYAFDDEGTKAEKQFVIKDGLLIRPLGGVVSQARAQMQGVANSRMSSWNRPPIDRMANLNLEPGNSSFDEMLSSIDKGIFVKSNSSWSIDDSRNKFQFGCEWGRLIEKGKLTKVVRNPNYRGVSANFWRNLKMVGNKDTFLALGSPYCGKGEPNQCIRVGHASPICLFSQVEIFGGE